MCLPLLGAAAEDLKTQAIETLFAGAEDLKTPCIGTLFAGKVWEIGNTKEWTGWSWEEEPPS